MDPLFSFILLLLFFLPSSISQGDAPRFWRIDCGGSESFTDERNATWVTDDEFVRSGENRVVNDQTTAIRKELQTLRVFNSTGTKDMKKYCYTIPVPKDTKVIATAWFYYGDYDGRGITPEFDVCHDGNVWSTITFSKDEPKMIESIYVTKRNGTSICLVRTTSGQDPFVSSIEVRTLKPDTYSGANVDSNQALLTLVRLAYGAKEPIMYPDDIYGRVWTPSTPAGYMALTNNATFVNTTINPTDDPPQAMLHSAIAPIDEYSNITISNIPGLFSDPVDVYYKMYFTEMRNLTVEKASRRSILFYVDGELYYKDEILPEYGMDFELYSIENKASSNTKYDLQRSNNSTLPPIISGLEYYQIYDVNQVTFEDDVQELEALQEHFTVLQEWTGDPCLPEEYNWEWVVCAHFTTPRIIALNLSGYGLSGSLPDFSRLDFLKTIDLSNNSFDGDIPDFLAKLPELKYLNLADNDFGSIPTSLRNKTTIELNISGNPKLKDALSLSPPANGGIKVEVRELVVIIMILFATLLVYPCLPLE